MEPGDEVHRGELESMPSTAIELTGGRAGSRTLRSSGDLSRFSTNDRRMLSTEKRAPRGKKSDHAIHRWSGTSDGSSAMRLRACRLVTRTNESA